MTTKIGLIVGREWSFPPAFIEEVNRRHEGVTAEFVKLGAPRMDDPAHYRVIIDRISHEVPFYRTWLKHMVLPNKEYIPGIIHTESLRNLEFPLDWKAVVDYVGLPCILKDAYGGGWKEVYVCRSLDELLHHYDHSGLLTMIVQEFIQWDEFVRCLCLGQEVIRPIKYDPKARKYHPELDFLPPATLQRVIDDSRTLVRALGYDMNSMEWAIRDGVPYAIDFMNPAPDMDVY